MTRPHQDRDVTLVERPAGAGMGFTRICFACQRSRNDRGGKTDKRTKMWNCASCAAAREAKK